MQYEVIEFKFEDEMKPTTKYLRKSFPEYTFAESQSSRLKVTNQRECSDRVWVIFASGRFTSLELDRIRFVAKTFFDGLVKGFDIGFRYHIKTSKIEK